jgi:hypothetical protein
MQERINLAQWDNDNDPQMIKKIKEMNTMWTKRSQLHAHSFLLKF